MQALVNLYCTYSVLCIWCLKKIGRKAEIVHSSCFSFVCKSLQKHLCNNQLFSLRLYPLQPLWQHFKCLTMIVWQLSIIITFCANYLFFSLPSFYFSNICFARNILIFFLFKNSAELFDNFPHMFFLNFHKCSC